MNEQLEFDDWPQMSSMNLPSFEQMVSQNTQAPNDFDPHKLMMKKKDILDGNVFEPEQKWPEKDIKTLEEFCKKYGIVGFNCGRMSPIAALSLLRQNLGIVDEERSTYSQTMKQKTLLMG
jgi:hypothetical protein